MWYIISKKKRILFFKDKQHKDKSMVIDLDEESIKSRWNIDLQTLVVLLVKYMYQ